MKLTFIYPGALWLLALLPLVWLLALLSPRRLRPLRFWAALLVRTVLIVSLALAVSGAQLVRRTDALTTVFLLDRSDSLTPQARARADAFVQEALAHKQIQDRVAVVAFGAGALVDQPPAAELDPGRAPVAPVASATDIGQALQLGLGLLPSDTAGRIVLLSDGVQTSGDAGSAAALAGARGVPVSYVDLSAAQSSEALVAGLEGPASVRFGQQFNLVAVVQSTVAQQAHLRILEGDRPLLDRDVALERGLNHIPVAADAHGLGFQRYRAELTPQQDSQAQNNAAEALVRVGGSARVLLVEGLAGAGQPLQDALRSANIAAERITPSAILGSLPALSQYDALVLIDVPSAALPPEAMQTIPAYVHDLGKGLLMIGGPQSYGSGGYNRTPIEEALPVYTDVQTKRVRPDVAIVFVLDKSGSMDTCHCNGPRRREDGVIDKSGPKKIDFAKEAIMRASAQLGPRDTVGVVAFDKHADWVYTLQRNVSLEALSGAIGPVKPDGATNLFGGLYAARLELEKVDAPIKHVVVLTDGWSKGNDPLYAAEEMRKLGITLTVVADGLWASPMLGDLAAKGGGRYFQVRNMDEVPAIYTSEIQQVAGNYLVEQPFTPKYAAASPILAGLTDGLPQLYGYNATTVKQTATAALLGLDDAPVLAQWQYGLGRSVAWTSDTQGRWAKDWLGWKEFPRFAAQLVGWTLPAESSSLLAASVRNEAGTTRIDASVQDPRLAASRDLAISATIIGADGARREVPVARVGPGSYSAAFPQPPQGTYMVELEGRSGDRVVAHESAGLVVSYAPEYGLGQGGRDLLAAVARSSGGAALADPAGAFAHDLPPASASQEIGLPLLGLALALLAFDVMLRRLFARPPSR
jgi:uncharacterized membrane protein